jgi:hypothetical protein
MCFEAKFNLRRNFMAGEKSKENKTLQSSCAACGKELSVELLRGRTVGSGRKRRIVPICQACIDKGWDPETAPAEETAAG